MASHISQPSGGITGNSGIDIQRFTAAGAAVWTKPAGAKSVRVFLISGGGGGGSGNTHASNVNLGGTGGGGGGASIGIFPASDLAATENIVVGAGGVGGAAVTALSTLGNTGNDGVASSFGDILSAGPGIGGTGGDITGSVPGVAGGVGNFGTGAASQPKAQDNTVVPGLPSADYGGSSGGDGGRFLEPAPLEAAGGDGGANATLMPQVVAGGIGGPNFGNAGTAGGVPTFITGPGTGGGAGTACEFDNEAGGAGGGGARGGGGGAGGGARGGTPTSGVGGDGGGGVVVVITSL